MKQSKILKYAAQVEDMNSDSDLELTSHMVPISNTLYIKHIR